MTTGATSRTMSGVKHCLVPQGQIISADPSLLMEFNWDAGPDDVFCPAAGTAFPVQSNYGSSNARQSFL